MGSKPMAGVAEKLKELIDENGPGYLSSEPYEAYKELLRSKATDRKTAGALLMLFASGIPDLVKPENDPAFLSKLIQKDCCLNKKMADTLADIVLSLHSRENEDEWKAKDKAGLEKFRKEELYVKWEGSATWKTSGGSVDCYYAADIVIKPTKALVINDKLSQSLKKNPFMKTGDIGKIYERDLKGYLDCEFEDHCTCDDYYPPVVVDFELESYLKDWCDENGFKIVACEGDGGDNGYEPDSVRRWIR